MKTNTIMVFVTTAFLLSACNIDKNDESKDLVDNTTPVAVQFTAGIGTRAFDQQWDVNDLIGVTGTSGDIKYHNIAYRTTTAGNGVFSAMNVGDEIYFQVPAPTSFTAYYPLVGNSGTAVVLITKFTIDQKDQKSFDYLYGTGTGSKAAPVVAFQFEHSMTKLTLNIKPGADITFADITGGSSTLNGVNHFGEFNSLTGVAIASGTDLLPWDMSTNSTASDVTLPTGSEIRTYSLILYPQTIALLTYSALINGEPYSATIGTTLTMETGKSYSYNITVNKTALIISEANITQWTDGNGVGGTDVDAEM